jgi:hypothetical protein
MFNFVTTFFFSLFSWCFVFMAFHGFLGYLPSLIVVSSSCVVFEVCILYDVVQRDFRAW